MALVSQITANFPRSRFVPDKSRGQHFLIDKNVLSKIVAAAELSKKDMVIEIGAGTGILTAELAKRAGRMVAFEVDRKLVGLLKEKFRDFKNVEIVEGDVLEKRYEIRDKRYKVVANIPYNITSAVLEKFLSAENKPSLMVLLVQKEVAERICAKPGEMSVLSVMVQYYGKPEIIATVPRSAFWPQPKVESAILKIKDIKEIFERNFFQIVKAGFSRRRKMLKNTLKSLNSLNIKLKGGQLDEKKIAGILKAIGLPPSVRAQELGVEQWKQLTLALKE